MTEKELRAKIVSIAQGYLGCKESNGSHKKIIDLYNAHKPLARGYAVKYTDAWCATFVSAVFIVAGLTDIAPTECGCSAMIELFKKLGRWQESDAYIPAPGDIIMYDWQDTGAGDNTGAPDHVGIVVSVTSSSIKIIEGNISNAVGYRTLAVNGKYIRGFCLPNYSSKAGAASSGTGTGGVALKVGDIVNFTGTTHYTSASAPSGKSCKPGKAKITQTHSGKHPYHLVAVSGGGSDVYGWVDAADIGANTVTQTVAVGSKVTIKAGAVYGGLTSSRGAKVPSYISGQNHRYTVKEIATHKGIQEALLSEITSWVALSYLSVV